MSEKPAEQFDASASQRFEYTVSEGGSRYKTAYKFSAFDDERYLRWKKAVKIKGDDKEIEENTRQEGAKFWDDIIIEVENIAVPDGEDFRKLIPVSEKIESLNNLLAVAIYEGETETGVRQLGVQTELRVVTECFWNGQETILRQIHTLRGTPDELEEFAKKYARIQAKRFKEEITKGLRRKPKIEFVPQDEAIGKLYDEMFVKQEGFADGIIPLRFKTYVIHSIFSDKLNEKK